MTTQSQSSAPASAEPVFVRPLGKMERSLWFCDQCSPTNIGFGCEVRGTVTEAALRSALRWCQRRHPLLRSVIRPKGKLPWFACYEPAAAPEIPLQTATGIEADEDALVLEELRQPLGSTGGLAVRVRLLRLGADRAFLHLAFSHLIGDGYSAALLLQDLINYLGRYAREGAPPDPQPLPFPPPSEEGIPAEHRGWAGFKKMMAFQKEVSAATKAFGAKPSPVAVAAQPPLDQRKIKTLGFRLTETETRALVARAKQEEVTVFALVGALLLDAMRPLLVATTKGAGGPERLASLAAPVDMRSFLTSPVKEQFGFYSSAINHLCRLGETNDVPALAKGLHADLKKSFFQRKVHLHTTPMFAAFLAWSWLFPLNRKGVARVAKMTDDMFRSVATSLTFLNDSIALHDDLAISISRPRGHISPSIMGTALYCVLLYKDVLSVYLNYNEGQLADAEAAKLNERFQANARAIGAARA